MVGEVGVAAAVICLAAVVGKGYGLLAAPVFFRRAEVARLMLRGGQHVGDLPGIGDVVVQAGLDDQVDGLLAGDPEPGGVLAVAVAHRKSLSLNRRILRREVALLVAGAVGAPRDLARRRSPDLEDLLAAQARAAAVPTGTLVAADPGQGEAVGGLC